MEPKFGDRVRVTYEAEYHKRNEKGQHVIRDSAGPLALPDNPTIEVLERKPVEGQAGVYGGSSVVVFRDGAWRWVQDGLLCQQGGVKPLPYKIVDL